MDVQKTQALYEVLVRFDNGTFVGAHTRRLETIVIDGEVISQREMLPEAVSQDYLAGLLDEQGATLLEQLASITDALTAANTDLASAAAAISRLEEQVGSLTASLNTSNAEAADIRHERDELRHMLDELLREAGSQGPGPE